jgi:crotonobetainyl-CoA:carnitine CoA-transferase CaiB-like acyl-CoA transferase
MFCGLALARTVEPVSKLDSLRVLEGAGVVASFQTVKRRLPVYAKETQRQQMSLRARHISGALTSRVPDDVDVRRRQGDPADDLIIRDGSPLPEVTTVSDAAMISEANQKAFDPAGLSFILAMKISHGLRWLPSVREHPARPALTNLYSLYKLYNVALERTVKKRFSIAEWPVHRGARPRSATPPRFFASPVRRSRPLCRRFVESRRKRRGISVSLLNGLVVVDCSLWLPGRLCSSNLSSLGAEVTSVFPPAGDPMARHNPALCRWLDIGKTQVKIDLTTDTGRGTLNDLLPRGAVVIEGYRKDTALRLGLSYDQLRDYCPDVVVCSLPAFRSGSAQDQLPAHDLQVQAFAGLLNPENPQKPSFALADVASAMVATIGLGAAIASRASSGHGCQIEIPMADVASYWSQVARATAPSESGGADIFVAGDGLPFALVVLGEKQREQFRKVITSLTGYAGELMRDDLVRLFQGANRKQWLDSLSSVGLAVSPVHSDSEARRHEYYSERHTGGDSSPQLPVIVLQEGLG